MQHRLGLGVYGLRGLDLKGLLRVKAVKVLSL